MRTRHTVWAGVAVAALAAGSAAGQEAGQPPAPAAADVIPGPEGLSWDAAQPGGTLPGDPRIELVKVADGFADPVNVVAAPDGSGRLFVIERPGIVRIVEDGRILDRPFLDISDEVLSAMLEQGLYDMAFDPNFAENGHVYLHFAELMRNGDSVIVRYTVSADDPDRLDRDSARLVMQIDQPWANHNGGEIEFGPDGYLYIGMGDGGWEGDPLEAGQDLSTPLGKLLRIDVHAEGRAYGIPEDNPFAGTPGLVQLFGIEEDVFARIHTEARPEIWSYGLRNPWKFSIDAETGLLFMPDVGQNHWEEINVLPLADAAGANFGWDFLMGTHCFPVQEESCARVGIPPVAEYDHQHGCAVIGLGVYRNEELPALEGAYLAGDFCSGLIWGLAPAEDGEGWQFAELLQSGVKITGGGTDPQGNVYVTSCECAYGDRDPLQNPVGTVWRVAAAGSVAEGATTAPTDGAGGHEHGDGAQ